MSNFNCPSDVREDQAPVLNLDCLRVRGGWECRGGNCKSTCFLQLPLKGSDTIDSDSHWAVEVLLSKEREDVMSSDVSIVTSHVYKGDSVVILDRA